jgi:cytochrome P450
MLDKPANRKVDIDPETHENIEARFAQMADVRGKCPVAYSSHLGGEWAVMRYEDIVKVAADPDTFGNAARVRWGRVLAPLHLDPPVHMDYRRLVAKFFTPRQMQRVEPRIRQSAVDLLAPLLARGHGDLATEVSYPLPMLGLCAVMNIDDADWPQLKTWGDQSLFVDSKHEHERERATVAHNAIWNYAKAMVAQRRTHPQDPEDDMTSAFLATEVEGKPLSDETVIGMLRLLISAGHNSTTSGTGNALLYLARDLEAQDVLRRDPSKIPAAVEELLRWETPVQEMGRIVKKDVEFGGVTMKAGEKVSLFFGSGNRDVTAFPEPEKCILDRKPNRHIAFGSGIHTCVGAPLARLEIRVALEELLARTKRFSINGDVERPPFHRMGVTQLPVQIET